ncbi:MAG: DHH family phosphoesterase [Lachnospiraceae bacterium]|nr:DHH family phosphoesterase [Lachnospiraceae bacterium]
MKTRLKVKGHLKSYMRFSIYLGLLLLALNAAIFLVSIQAGVLLCVFTVFYFVVTLTLYYNNKPLIMNELVSFATEYGQIQRKLLKELDIPYALLDEDGKVMWTNYAFEQVTEIEGKFTKSITSLFPVITGDKLPRDEENTESEFDIEHLGKDYTIKLKRIPLKEMAENSAIIEAEGYNGYLIALFMFDKTALNIALQELDDQSLCVGMIYLDNFDEAMESVEEVKQSLLAALIDRKVNKYISSVDGICRKMEKDKYLIILRKKAIAEMQDKHFELLSDIKTVKIGENSMSVTTSIGLGTDGLTYAQNYEYARNAIDLALGRGGDQAVIKTKDQVTYYGGKSQTVEKNTRVKARVKAQALREIITAKENVLIMGHRNPDADAFGAAVGIYCISKVLGKNAYIVMDNPNSDIQPIVDTFVNGSEEFEDVLITSQQAIDFASTGSVLVVVDVNKPSITECPDLIKYCKTIVVLDHHRAGNEVIENATLSYIEPYASSACEMISEILQYAADNVKIRPEEADCMYSGIMVDSNNFQSKAGVRTFEAAAFLRRCGADVTRVRKMFRADASEYKAKADAVSQAEIYRGSYAISICTADDCPSPTVIGAQAANELLNIRGIKASFVLTEFGSKIHISARSIDEVNVQLIMERMGGGGHLSVAACQLEGTQIEEAIGELKNTIDSMMESGEI